MKIRLSQWVLVVAFSSALAGLSACTTQRVSPSPGSASAMPGLGPVLTVERFLQAANTRDLATMAALFGTHDGPLEGRREDLELRMDAIAMILEYDDYEIGAESREPGRTDPTRRVLVTLVQGARRIEDVPFLVVETDGGAWMIEEIALNRITAR